MISVPGRDRHVYAALIGISVLLRLPLLPFYDLVSYDGTYYINQARLLWSAAPQPGAFPVGYPFFISLFLPLAGDGVRAAQIVSFAAAMGALVVFFRLALCYLDRTKAFLCAVFLAITPLFVRLSLQTFSESLFTFFLLLTLWLFARGRDEGTGVAGGLAAVTRPEMLGVAGVLFALRVRAPRRALLMILPFLLVFSLNALKFYQSDGRFTPLPKSEFFASGAQSWTQGEQTVTDLVGGGEAPAAPSALDVASFYFGKIPEELYLLARNTGLLMLLLAAFGMWRRPTFLLAILVPFFIGPLFTVRSIDRYLLPYVPVVILYGFIGAGYLKDTRFRGRSWAALGLSALLAVVLNAGLFTRPTDDGLPETREAGVFLHDVVEAGDIVADRKPYVAFYAGAEYMEIPFDSYEGTLRYLVDNNARFLSLHYGVLRDLRPIVANLLTDPAVVAGELRYRQVWGHRERMLLYGRTGVDDPLRWRMVDNPGADFDTSPAWSPDGQWIAFSSKVGGHLDIFVVSAGGGERTLLAGGVAQDDQPAFSPNGRFIAFSSSRGGDWNIHLLDRTTGDVRRLTRDPAHDSSPCWAPDGGAVYFMSERSGKKEIWRIRAAGGAAPEQLTGDGDNDFPAVSPDGKRLAWTQINKGLRIRDLSGGGEITVAAPREVNYAPAWSPDGRFLAVSGRDWGSVDVYLVTADGTGTLLLTKNAVPGPDIMFDAMPAWSPDGGRLALISSMNGPRALYVLDGLQPYLDRLENPVRSVTFPAQ
jgi:Tol biopolymer transport system component/4-amino-4-deoxy-L-arabinose transferase-like glycosyltransferase